MAGFTARESLKTYAFLRNIKYHPPSALKVLSFVLAAKRESNRFPVEHARLSF